MPRMTHTPDLTATRARMKHALDVPWLQAGRDHPVCGASHTFDCLVVGVILGAVLVSLGLVVGAMWHHWGWW